MAEGPQVLLRTKWLSRYLEGKQILHASSCREDLREASRRISGARPSRAFCRGKHIFIQIGTDAFIYNHMLMQGRWRRYPGGMLIPPDNAWLQLDTGSHTICNLSGQILRLLTRSEAAEMVDGLGPDAMRRPFPGREIESKIRAAGMPVAEAILDQSICAGIGNIAKSEILHRACIAPEADPSGLRPAEMARLLKAIEDILWESYDLGGRWLHRVYRRRGQPCSSCGHPLQMVRQAPSRRSTYYCPSCQPDQTLRLI